MATGVPKATRAAPYLQPAMAGVDVGRQTRRHVDHGTVAPEHFATAGIPQRCSGRLESFRIVLVFLNGKHLEPRTVGVDVGQMHRVAVPQPRGVQPGAIVVDNHSLIDDLVPTISIHVGDAERVSAHARVGRGIVEWRPAHAAVEDPTAGQRTLTPIPGDDGDAAIHTAAHHEARVFAVEIRDAGQMAIAAIAVGVVPRIAADASPAVDGVATWHIVGRRQCPAGHAVEHREVFGPVENPAIAGRSGLKRPPVLRRITDWRSRAVDGAVGRLAGDLGPAVTVEIVGHELRVVLPFTDVFSQRDSPQQRAIHLIRVEHRLARHPGRAVVPRPRCLVKDDFEFAVTVEISHRGVARAVVFERLNRDLEVALAPRRSFPARRPLDAVAHAANLVAEIGHLGRSSVDDARRSGQRFRVDPDRRSIGRLAVDIEGDVVGIGAQESPTDEHAPLGPWQSHDSTRQILHLSVCARRSRRRGGQKKKQQQSHGISPRKESLSGMVVPLACHQSIPRNQPQAAARSRW